MKKLILIRHAQAITQDNNLDDYDRPLDKNGLKEAKELGDILAKKNFKPDLIISSPAKRAIQTAEIISDEIKYEKSIMPNQYIYEAYVNTLQEIISFLHDDNDTVFLVGHNPGISVLAYMFCNLKENIPTAATVEINFDCNSWLKVSQQNASLISYDFPTKLN